MGRHSEITRNYCIGCYTSRKEALLRTVETDSLLTCISALMENRDFRETANVIFQACKKLIGVNNGFLLLFEDGGRTGRLIFVDFAHAHMTPPLSVPVIGLCAEARKTGRTVFSNSAVNDLWEDLLPAQHNTIENMMFIPLVLDGVVRGMLSLANKPGGFTEHDVEQGTIFGKFASLALQHTMTTDKIRESEDKYRRLVEILPEAVMVVSQTGIIFTNRAAQKLFGANFADEIHGRPLSTLIHPDSLCAAQCRLQQVLQGENVSALEKKVVRLDGSTVDVEVSAAPFTYKGKPAGLVVMRDLTQRKLSESQEQMTTKLEAVSILAGGIAHDFNNLLTIILGNLSIARMYATGNTVVYEKLREIENAAMQTKDLTRQLLTFAKEDTLVKQAALVDKLLRETIPFILHGTNVTAQLSFADGLPPAEVDAAQFSQVIHNIIINAVQAMPDGGTIRVAVKSVQALQLLCLSHSQGNYLEIKISDQGCGISPEHLGKIFEPFFTTKEQGNGLGLATSYNIIKQHGGYMTVESTVGSGTTFILYLPASDTPVGVAGREEELYHGRGTVLVMDDEPGIRKTAGEMLSILGFDVEYAHSGEDALQYYREKQEEGKPYRFVILDKTVRGGMGGEKTMKKLLRIDPQVKALISSGYAHTPLLTECEKYGFRGYVSKPYKIEELSSLIQKIL